MYVVTSGLTQRGMALKWYNAKDTFLREYILLENPIQPLYPRTPPSYLECSEQLSALVQNFSVSSSSRSSVISRTIRESTSVIMQFFNRITPVNYRLATVSEAHLKKKRERKLDTFT